MKRAWLIGAGGYVLLVLSVNLAGFPGLHGDEAWFGLEALRIQGHGLTTAHGMNPYTGALFPWLLAEASRVLPPSVLTLRLPGVLLNTAALLILLWSVERAAGRRRAILLFLLFGSSLLFLWLSRVAWEVTALQPLLLAVMVAAVLDAGTRGRWTAPGITAFLLASELGVVNHLIFSAIPTSFLAAAVVVAGAGAGRRSPATTESVWIGALAVGSMFLALLVVWGLPDAIFTQWSGLVMAALVAWPLAAARWLRTCPPTLERWLERARPRWLLAALLLGAVGFAALHGIAFVGTVADVLPMMRLASWAPALPGTLLGYGWGLVVAGAFAAGARETIRRLRRGTVLGTPDLVTLWALACMAAVALLTGRQSLRHYVLPSALLYLAVALSLPAYRRTTHLFGLIAALAFLAVNAVAWRGILYHTNRRPLRFRVGYGYEVSNHFIRLDALIRDLEARGICRTEATFFIEEPLAFYRATRPWACATDRVYRLRYCEDCPPWYVSLEPAGPP